MSDGNGTAVAVQEQPKAQNLYRKLKAMEAKIAEVAVEELPPRRLIGIVMTGVLKMPKLLDCSFESILHGVMEAGQLGLEPSGPQGHAYLIPRWNSNTRRLEAHLQLGYRGLVSLARRSGRVRDIEAHVVHEHDSFAWKLGIDPKLDHTPNLDGDRGQPTHVYAIAWPTDPHARPIFEVMSRDQVEHIREHSADEKSPAWNSFWTQMARKTVIRRLCNYLDLSPDVAQVIERDDERAFPGFHEAQDADGKPERQVTRTEAVMAALGVAEEEDEEEGEDPGDAEYLEGGVLELPSIEGEHSIASLEEQAGVGPKDREAICEKIGIKSPVHGPDEYAAELRTIIEARQEQEA